MDTFNPTGSIVKKEVLLPIQKNTLSNIAIYEASNPYANYYGHIPQQAKPNSLFLITKQFFFLEEILSSVQKLDKCLLQQINIAAAVIQHNNKEYPAIRIKNFPDYSKLSALHSCLNKQGIEFMNTIHISGELQVRINKLFRIKEVANGMYLDLTEAHKGYFMCENKITSNEFADTISHIKNSSACKLFDAVQGTLLKDGNVIEIVRVFSEGLDQKLLSCLKKEFTKSFANNQVLQF